MTKLSARAEKALRVLTVGGEFVQRIERDYYGREKFRYRLLTFEGRVVPNVGLATFYEIESKLSYKSSTSVSTYYGLGG